MTVFGTILALSVCLFGAGCAEAQTSREVEHLAALGKVWGFLKYYHPGVAAGSVHWDSAVVAAVPKVRAARTNAEFRATVQRIKDRNFHAPASEPRTVPAPHATVNSRA